MSNSVASGKIAGLAGSVMCAVGVVLFFIGIFGGPRTFAFTGLGLIVFSLVCFFIEEQQNRRSQRS
jgi:hypothetical protein